jgi:hypothetical protein
MLSTNINIIRRFNIKACSSKCKCINQINIITNKPIPNIIAEAFLNFQLKDQMDKYEKCIQSKKIINLDQSL